MVMKHANKKRTICEVLRKANDLVQGDTHEEKQIRKLLAEAEIMAKKITTKLIEYKIMAGENGWIEWDEENREYLENMITRMKEGYKIGQANLDDFTP